MNHYLTRLKYVAGWIIYSLIFWGFGLPGAVYADVEVVDRIVAVVNDEIISLFELEQALKPYIERIKSMNIPSDKEPQMRFKIRTDMLNQMIEQKLTDQETKRLGITVDEKEIDNTIERIKEAYFYTDEDLREALAREGMTMAEHRKSIKEQILRSKLVNLEVKSKVVITKEDIKKYYETHIDDYRGGKKYHLRNILKAIPEFADDREKERIRQKMEGILKQLKAGLPFEKLAREHSESPSAADGGDLGGLNEDLLSAQIKEAVEGLKPGEFTGILDTDLGYQIFFVQEIKEAQIKSLAEASSEIEEKLFNEIVNEKFKSWLGELRKRSHIKIIK